MNEKLDCRIINAAAKLNITKAGVMRLSLAVGLHQIETGTLVLPSQPDSSFPFPFPN